MPDTLFDDVDDVPPSRECWCGHVLAVHDDGEWACRHQGCDCERAFVTSLLL